MEIEQMMARLLAEIRTNREEMKTNQETTDTSQEMLVKMEANQAEMKTNQVQMLARMEAKMDINLKEMKKEIRTN
jgi:hypothetical protein